MLIERYWRTTLFLKYKQESPLKFSLSYSVSGVTIHNGIVNASTRCLKIPYYLILTTLNLSNGEPQTVLNLMLQKINIAEYKLKNNSISSTWHIIVFYNFKLNFTIFLLRKELFLIKISNSFEYFFFSCNFSIFISFQLKKLKRYFMTVIIFANKR